MEEELYVEKELVRNSSIAAPAARTVVVTFDVESGERGDHEIRPALAIWTREVLTFRKQVADKKEKIREDDSPFVDAEEAKGRGYKLMGMAFKSSCLINDTAPDWGIVPHDDFMFICCGDANFVVVCDWPTQDDATRLPPIIKKRAAEILERIREDSEEFIRKNSKSGREWPLNDGQDDDDEETDLAETA